MCELFGVTSFNSIPVRELLTTFFSHADRNPDGWGIAFFYEKEVLLEKQEISALKSGYLKARLPMYTGAKEMIAHIRLATKGHIEYENTHPFICRDNTGRNWTFAHNGTIFENAEVDRMFYEQKGQTDSERILLYIIKRMNMRYPETKSAAFRFRLLEEIVKEITPENKVNLLLYDGEIMYVHSNYRNSLYMKQGDSSFVFSTKPLDSERWEPVPLNTLLGFSAGSLLYTGQKHPNEFFDKPEKTRHLYLDYSAL